MNLLVIFIVSTSKFCLCLFYTNHNLSILYLFVSHLIACSFGKESKWLVLYYIMSTCFCAWLFSINIVQWINWYPKRGPKGKLFYYFMLACHFLKQMLNGSLFTIVNTKSSKAISSIKLVLMFQELPLSNEMKFTFLTVTRKASITGPNSPASSIGLHTLLPSSCSNSEWQALLISMPGTE